MKIHVKHLSPRILGRLKKGHAVRLSPPEIEGEGLQLVVSPGKYNEITRSFGKMKGTQQSLSPEEIAGSGLGGKVSKSHKSQKTWEGVQKVFKEVVPKKVSRAITDKVVKQIEDLPTYKDSPQGQEAAVMSGVGLYGGSMHDRIIERINHHTGQHIGAARAAQVAQHRMGQEAFDLAKLQMRAREGGQGLYAQAHTHAMGRGIRQRQHRFIEKGTVGGVGTLMGHGLYGSGLPQALQSQPLTANFMFGSRLPVAYQHNYKSAEF